MSRFAIETEHNIGDPSGSRTEEEGEEASTPTSFKGKRRFAEDGSMVERRLRGTNGAVANLKNHLSQRQQRLAAYTEYIDRETSHESFVKMLEKFSDTFDSQLKEFLEKLWTDSYKHHAQLSNLCVRLDYNGFYSTQFSLHSEFS
jgi:gamma-tubulin complex component 2